MQMRCSANDRPRSVSNRTERADWAIFTEAQTAGLLKPCGDSACRSLADFRLLTSYIRKGSRIIVCHAGGLQGWIKGKPLIFKSKKTKDYHEEMNSETFEKWFLEQLLPSLQPDTTIIMDNASYHSRLKEKTPTTSSRKAVILEWLKAHHIPCSEKLLKPELLNLVKRHKPPPIYVLDEEAKNQGHRVLRLPPYHCQYNSIEMVWSWLKGYVKKNNATQNLTAVEGLFKEAINHVTPEMWGKYVNHVKKDIQKAWELEGLADTEVEEFLIHLGADEEDDEEEYELEDEDEYIFMEGIADDLGVGFLPPEDA